MYAHLYVYMCVTYIHTRIYILYHIHKFDFSTHLATIVIHILSNNINVPLLSINE